MKRSTVVQEMRRQYISAGCPAWSPVDSGHSAPWKESARNLIVKNTPQFQVGGFNGAITMSLDRSMTAYTVFNTTGWSSLVGESTWGPKLGWREDLFDNHTGRGLGQNVRQIFSWSEPNPCHQ